MLQTLLLLALAGDPAPAPLVVRSYDLTSTLSRPSRGPSHAVLFPSITRSDLGDDEELVESEPLQIDVVVDHVQRLYSEEFQQQGWSLRYEESRLVVSATEAAHAGILELLQFFEGLGALATPLAVDVVTLPALPAAAPPSVLAAADAEKLLASLAQGGRRASFQLDLRPGATGTVEVTNVQDIVLDYDAEIAQAAAILDPIVAVVRTGLRLNVRAAAAPGGSWLAVLLRSGEPVGPVQDVELGFRSKIVAQERDLGDVLAADVQSITVENRSIALNTFLAEGRALVIQAAIGTQDRKGAAVFVLRAKGKALPRELRHVPAAGAERAILALPWGFAVPPCLRFAGDDGLFASTRSSEFPGRWSIQSDEGGFVVGFDQPGAELLFDHLRGDDPSRLVDQRGPWVFVTREPGYEPPAVPLEPPETVLARLSPSPRLFQLAFTLKRTGPDGGVVARLVVPARASEPLLAVLGTEQSRVFDYDVEVAQSATVADPDVYSAFEGLVVHARPSVTLRGELVLGLRAKGRAQRGAPRQFDPGAKQLGPIPQGNADVLVIDEQLAFAKEGGTRVLPLASDAGAAAGTALVLEVEMTEVR
jgi:hypothetical protein